MDLTKRQRTLLLALILFGTHVLVPGLAESPKRREASPPLAPSTLYRVNQANLKSYKDADLSLMTKGIVTRVIDGDSLEVTIQGRPYRVRLIGVDTPETRAPGRPVERFGREASHFTRTQLQGRVVHLAFDWDLEDRFGRLLAYVYLPNGNCFNAELIRQGYGHAYTRFPFQFLEEFRSLEQEARRARRGLWGF